MYDPAIDDNVSHLAGDAAFSLAVTPSGDGAYVGPNDNTVQLFDLSSGSSKSTLARFTAEVTALAVSADGRTLVAGAADMNVRIIDTENFEDELLDSAHDAPVTWVALDTTGQFLLTSGCDGAVKVWRLKQDSDGNTKTVATLRNLWPESSDVIVSKCRGIGTKGWLNPFWKRISR